MRKHKHLGTFVRMADSPIKRKVIFACCRRKAEKAMIQKILNSQEVKK